MDLGRTRLRQFIGQNVAKVGSAFGHALDTDLAADPKETGTAGVFEIAELNEEFERSLELLRPGCSPEKVLGALSSYFEGGSCLRVENNRTFLTSLFLFGQTFTPAEAHGTPVDFGFKEMEFGRVYKMSLSPLLRELSVGPFARVENASAFAFALSEEVIFVLFDDRPHPWQVFAIEAAYLSVRDAFSRVQRVRR